MTTETLASPDYELLCAEFTEAANPFSTAFDLRIPALDISSSQLRERLSQGRSVDFLIPEPAIRCIRQLNLYAGTR